MSNHPEILEFAFERVCCVYFLLRDHNVIYVGQTVDLHQRVATHYREAVKKFDRIEYFPCPKSELDEQEAFWISHYRPAMNGSGPNAQGLWTGLTTDQLMEMADERGSYWTEETPQQQRERLEGYGK